METSPSIRLKCALLGDVKTGKSAFLKVLINDIFIEEYRKTSACSFFDYYFFCESLEFDLSIWEISGNPRYRSLAPKYFGDAEACILFYDITNLDSFENIKYYIDTVSDVNPRINIFVVGNKNDLENMRMVTFEEAKKRFDEFGVQFWEISCKNKLMINTTAEIVAHSCL